MSPRKIITKGPIITELMRERIERERLSGHCIKDPRYKLPVRGI